MNGRVNGRKVLLLVATVGIVTGLRKEYPAIVRYLKIKRM